MRVMAADGSKRSLEEAGGAAELFVVEEVVRATGGVSPCFLYRGRRGDGAAAPERACKRRHTAAAWQQEEEGEDQLVPDCGAASSGGSHGGSSGACEGQLELYISFEQASPSPKMRQARAPQQQSAPYRLSIRDANDNLLLTHKCLPAQLVVDEQRCEARWGEVCIAFPSLPDLTKFTTNLRLVAVVPSCGGLAAACGKAAVSAADGQATPRGVPPLPAHWAVAAGKPPRPAALPSRRVASPPLAVPEAPAAAWQQERSEERWALTPPALSWSLAAALHVTTPPPLNRFALSGPACDALAHAPAAPIPAPVPFALPIPAKLAPVATVFDALSVLEAGIGCGAGW